MSCDIGSIFAARHRDDLRDRPVQPPAEAGPLKADRVANSEQHRQGEACIVRTLGNGSVIALGGAMIPADLDIGDDNRPAPAGLASTLARARRLHPVLVVTGGGRPARRDPDAGPVLPVAGAIRRASHGCPHCVGLTGTCCQCFGSRLVTADIAMRNGNWLWAFPGCVCQVCRKLAIMLDAIVEPGLVRERDKADVPALPNQPVALVRP
jgi:hypothetical protein